MNSAAQDIPSLRWGVLGTGWVSTNFVTDLIAPRPSAAAKHTVAAVGSSSNEKGAAFVQKVWKDSVEPRLKVYDDYQSVYNDSDVEIVYIGTPHAMHKQNCLDAIAAGKHILCEKPFTINEHEAQEVVDAARAKGVFVMEAVWTRFFPLMKALREHLFVKKSIGSVKRLFIDVGFNKPIDTMSLNSRQRDPALGAGVLLDLGIYGLTYASLVLGAWKVGKQHPTHKVNAVLELDNGIDMSDVAILSYEADATADLKARTAVVTATVNYRSDPDFARIEGSEGTIIIFGLGASCPSGFRLIKGDLHTKEQVAEEVFQFDQPKGTLGFCHEADAVALDIASGKLEDETMPLDETLRVLKLMDTVRRQGGLVYPQDRV